MTKNVLTYIMKITGCSLKTCPTEHIQPFDAILLDYKMPKINGMNVAKGDTSVNPHQRIIFASAYIQETFMDSIKH